jgi:hypothetical protein
LYYFLFPGVGIHINISNLKHTSIRSVTFSENCKWFLASLHFLVRHLLDSVMCRELLQQYNKMEQITVLIFDGGVGGRNFASEIVHARNKESSVCLISEAHIIS